MTGDFMYGWDFKEVNTKKQGDRGGANCSSSGDVPVSDLLRMIPSIERTGKAQAERGDLIYM
jgi:hypothetical protein